MSERDQPKSEEEINAEVSTRQRFVGVKEENTEKRATTQPIEGRDVMICLLARGPQPAFDFGDHDLETFASPKPDSQKMSATTHIAIETIDVHIANVR